LINGSDTIIISRVEFESLVDWIGKASVILKSIRSCSLPSSVLASVGVLGVGAAVAPAPSHDCLPAEPLCDEAIKANIVGGGLV